MDILRPIDGVYQCINNPNNRRKYVLREVEGSLPVLVRIEGDDDDKAVHEKELSPQNDLFAKLQINGSMGETGDLTHLGLVENDGESVDLQKLSLASEVSRIKKYLSSPY
ncbi:hypothetical protein [Paenibacillus sp. GM2]|uniref:hypothetical protein n=1 Tax=Paenibacillus sp. GM2 TaxID=1622070 RepID=UPI0008395CDE|nr:hypothetical protein [Paenibacillus sp. GM2]